MRSQIYVDDVLAYDSLAPGYAMGSALLTTAQNKGGTLELTIYPSHPAYDRCKPYAAEVKVVKGGSVRWRGRPLPPTDAMAGQRTVVCEGELCWLNDAVIRPYLYQDSPEAIFRDLIGKYNTVVEPWKRFEVGTVTIKDPNDYVRVESESAAKILDVVGKLLERYGGYITFEGTSDARTINWYQDPPYACNQSASLAKNITDFIAEPDLEGFATRCIPYGAKQEDGSRLQIDLDGKDYVQDDAAVAGRGVIEASVIFDDITLPGNLERAARNWLYSATQMPRSIQLSAVDLSKIDASLDAFCVGQMVLAEDAVIGGGRYTVTQVEEDLCDPRVGGITLGRTAASLIGAEQQQRTEQAQAIEILGKEVKNELQNLTVDMRVQITEAVQSSQAVIFSALDQYSKTSDLEKLKETLSAQLAVMADQIAIDVSRVTEQYEAADGILRAQIEEIAAHYRFTDNGQYIGLDGSDAVMRLFNDILQIIVSGVVSTQVDRDGLTAERANIRMLNMGPYTWKYNDTDGHLALM